MYFHGHRALRHGVYDPLRQAPMVCQPPDGLGVGIRRLAIALRLRSFEDNHWPDILSWIAVP
jgi:hypothetical protein